MSTLSDCRDPDGRDAGLAAAEDALRRGALVVLPTDTVYGVGADAFDPAAVAALLAAKGRDRSMPPPVLVHDVRSVDALVERSASGASSSVDALAEAFWPGGLTLVCWAQPSLRWDLGDTGGTVAVRVPDDDVARALLARTGPLAVSSANLTGEAPGATAEEARTQLGEAVEVYLEDGPRDGGAPSTVLDLTGARPEVLREGAVSLEELRRVVPDVRAVAPPPPPAGPADDGATADATTDAPATDAPATDAPATDAPATDAPATDAPATDAPATDGPRPAGEPGAGSEEPGTAADDTGR
ncbi:L-threonylcarbamoyladenylate synthase [Pseudokineococcus lusitanus]|uniref:L-threonylcarbamoyladenylate synthase n=1 Tax=Pseudokineococcus lusitanus TaxID=763993 RepID=A0A3N1HN42_9ACTN|nr:L-threonylcarbamoyladenylate synthase [Pseudokineococcus lusitanus]ROP43876.1 translation factor SUA5 [Pseudokineococcus lusitanus]